jgi:hypothetical protein
MTEAQWLDRADPYARQLLIVQEHASIRKLRLIAATLVRHLQVRPEHDDAKRCDDIIEAAADQLRPWEQLEPELWARPGLWRFAHILYPTDPDRVVMELRKLVAFYHFDPPGYPLDVIIEVVGNPFRPVVFSPDWRTNTAVTLARQMYEAREFGAMPILADALQDAGCDNGANPLPPRGGNLLDHCRDDEPHVRGCWVVDLVLGKE